VERAVIYPGSAYKRQTAVDAKQGFILDVEVTTGGVHDGKSLSSLDEVPRGTDRSITIATLVASYGVARVYAELEARRVESIVPTRHKPAWKKGLTVASVQTGSCAIAGSASASCLDRA
jgi:hypothetical protein